MTKIMTEADKQKHLEAFRNGDKKTKSQGAVKSPYQPAYGAFLKADADTSLDISFTPVIKGSGSMHKAKLTQGALNLLARIVQFEGLGDKSAAEVIQHIQSIYEGMRGQVANPVGNASIEAEYQAAHITAAKTRKDDAAFCEFDFAEWAKEVAKLNS